MADSSHIEMLERKLKGWLNSPPNEPSIDAEYKWHRRGLEIIRELLPLKPDDVELRKNLALTLRWLGQDLKVRLDNRGRARELLEEALTLRPDDALVHYHLGWLASKQSDRKLAAMHFQRALEGLGLAFPLRIRALCNLVKLLTQKGDIAGATMRIRDAKTLLSEQRIRGQQVPQDCVTMVELAEMDLEGQRGMYPYNMECSDGSTRLLTHEDAMELLGQRTSETLTLFLLQTHIELKGPISSWMAPDSLALGELCERLMTARSWLKGDVLHDEIWPTGGKSTVTSSINRLRDHFTNCMGPEGRDAITTHRQYGYRWNPNIAWQIVRDVNEPY